VVDSQDLPYQGHVDNLLLTGIDKLLQKHKIDRSALRTVTPGPGIDKNSSLDRIVKAFVSAVAVARKGLI
jgi:hypothetical protein